MNNYQFLVSEREQGRFGEYMRRGLIGLNLNEWIEVYQYHLEHLAAIVIHKPPRKLSGAVGFTPSV